MLCRDTVSRQFCFVTPTSRHSLGSSMTTHGSSTAAFGACADGWFTSWLSVENRSQKCTEFFPFTVTSNAEGAPSVDGETTAICEALYGSGRRTSTA